jgi:hypothetical protein
MILHYFAIADATLFYAIIDRPFTPPMPPLPPFLS